MTDFLLELRCEEIPARMQKGARADLEKLFAKEMAAAGIAAGDVTVYSTPRRLALIARGLPLETDAVSEEAKGPPEGAPDQAVDGFCRKNGVTRDQLEVRDVKGRQTYFAVINKPGRAVAEVLAQAIPAIIRAFPWPKSMRWGNASISTESLKWVRPLSGIVAIFGDALVECEIDGMTSGTTTMGHRFHHSGEVIITGADDYAAKLRDAHVIVDHAEREAIVRTGAAKAATDAGLDLVEDEGLVVENAGLTEWPVPLLGRFEDDFLEVPPETIQLTARVNQKYFVCEQDGKLANAFICTANIEAADGGAAIVDGNRKVLAARLSDARFFWDVDRKKTLEEHAEGLERITFHEKLGTVADKVQRVAKLARWLVEEGIVGSNPTRETTSRHPREGGDPATSSSAAPKVSGTPASAGATGDVDALSTLELADQAELAARLCKADLVTEMVGEFPELQGLMGGYYARAEGLDDAVADAIRDHYKPVGQGDDVPTAPVTVAVSLADKLDTLVSFFAIDEKPTGSKDPFALRRATLAIIRLIQLNGYRVNLGSAIRKTHSGYILGLLSSIDTTSFPSFHGDKSKEITYKSRGENTEIYLSGELKATFPTSQSKSFRRYSAARQQPDESALLNFFADRLKVQQREAGVRHDLIDAVFALGGEDDLVRLLARVHALQAFMETEDGTNLLAGYKRAANILKKEDWLTSPLPTGEGPGVGAPTSEMSDTHTQPSPSRERATDATPYTPEPAEKALIDALDVAEPKAAAAIGAEDFTAAMGALASLRAPIDAFFEEVTVNADEENKRAARLDLLARFRAAVHNVADFSKIEG